VGVRTNCGGNYAPVQAQFAPAYQASGGAGGAGGVDGYLRLTDADNVCQFFGAPAPYSGNKLAFYGGRLSFWLRCNVDSWRNDNVVVLVPQTGTPLVAAIEMPTVNWRAYEVPLLPGAWRVGSKTGAVATEAQLRGVLGTLQSLRLPAEFGATVPEENSDLDEVRLVGVCGPSDVAGAGQVIGFDGSLTADDIIVFIGWFFAGDARADVAGAGQAPGADGTFTADDIIVFINRFFAGC
jgi:hypothetical protein